MFKKKMKGYFENVEKTLICALSKYSPFSSVPFQNGAYSVVLRYHDPLLKAGPRSLTFLVHNNALHVRTAITLTKVVLPEFCKPTNVNSISSFQNKLLNQSSIRLIKANMLRSCSVTFFSVENCEYYENCKTNVRPLKFYDLSRRVIKFQAIYG